MEAEEEVMRRMLKEEQVKKLEEKYCVRVSARAFDLAVVHGLSLSLDGTPEKVVEILDGACKLVLEKFRNCGHESELSEKAYQLRRALVEIIELHGDSHRHTQSWLRRVKLERDSASIYMNDFVQKWEHVLVSPPGGGCDGILTPEYAKCVCFLNKYALGIAYLEKERSRWDLASVRSDVAVASALGPFLDDVQRQIIKCVQSLLTVKTSHVAEVVSSMTDVPLTQIFPSPRCLKKRAIHRTKQRVVNQDHIIDEIFEVLSCDCERQMTTRSKGLFLLLGPPGVGKREIAKAITEFWYCDVSRLVTIDMAEYAEPPQLEPASYDLFEWSKRKHQHLWSHLTEAVRKRPYSIILLDRIDEASTSITGCLFKVLCSDTPTDIEGNPVDYSKSIIFMTSRVGANQLELACTCFDPNAYSCGRFMSNLQEFCETHNCDLKGSGRERVIVEAGKFLSADLLDSFDKVFVVEEFRNKKNVARLLLREIAREVAGGRFIMHASDSALDVLLWKASKESVGAGTAIKKTLLEHIFPQLSAAEGCDSAVMCVDTLVGTSELSFRIHPLEQSLEDWYFKQEDGTFENLIANLRMKVKLAHTVFDFRRAILSLLDCPGQYLSVVGHLLLAFFNSILSFPSPSPPPMHAFEGGASCNVAWHDFPTLEEKEEVKNHLRRLHETNTGVTKATHVIIKAVVKIIDAPLESVDLPARHYLFLGLDDDAKTGLINDLTELLTTSSGKSLLTHVKLENNSSGEVQKKMLIEEVKRSPCRVLLFDGVESADAVLYKSLLEIIDKGTLDSGEGFVVDFRKTIVILTSEAANKHTLAKHFNYKEKHAFRSIPINQSVRRFRTELLHRIDEIILFDPILPVDGGIIHIHKRDGYYKKLPNDVLLSLFLFDMFEAQTKQQYKERDLLSCSSEASARFNLHEFYNFTKNVHYRAC